MTAMKVLVRRRALLMRINRKLIADGEALKAARGARMRRQVGLYYRVDTRRGCLIQKNVDLDEFGRRLNTLKPWEALADS
jgi:hypothetical protein